MKNQPLRTTVIGSYPFPGWLEAALQQLDQFGEDDLAELLDDAATVAIHDQAATGLDVITDGEQTGIDLKKPCNYLAQHGFIGLYSIGLCMKSSHTLKKYSLSYRDANNYEELEQALVEATAESDVFDPNLFDENLYKADSTDR